MAHDPDVRGSCATASCGGRRSRRSPRRAALADALGRPRVDGRARREPAWRASPTSSARYGADQRVRLRRSRRSRPTRPKPTPARWRRSSRRRSRRPCSFRSRRMGKDLAPRVAAARARGRPRVRLRGPDREGRPARGTAARCTRARPTRPCAGRASPRWRRCVPTCSPWATRGRGAQGRGGEGERSDTASRAQVTAVHAAAEGKVELTEAQVIVSGGPRPQGPRELPPGAGARRGLRGGGGGLARRGGRGLGRSPAPGGTDGQDRVADALHRLRHQRRHPAPGRHVVVEVHRGHQQGRRTRRSSRSRTTGSWATCSRSCRSSPRRPRPTSRPRG